MKLSARNQLEGKVTKVKKGMLNSEITLDIGGPIITSIITNDSCEQLNIKEGIKAIAIIKASSILIGAGNIQGLSARNQLKGIIESIKLGSVNAEIALKVGNHQLVSIITLASSKELGIAIGDEVTAIIKASSVILGVH